MQNRPVLVARGSARVSRAGFGVAPRQSFPNATTSISSNTGEKCAVARRARQHAKRARYPIVIAALFVFPQIVCHAEETTPTPSPNEAEFESATILVASPTPNNIVNDHTRSAIWISRANSSSSNRHELSMVRPLARRSVKLSAAAGRATSTFTNRGVEPNCPRQ